MKEYNNRGRKTQETFADGSFEKITYSASGQLVSLEDTRGDLIVYSYNAGNQPLSIQITRGVGVSGTTQQVFTYDSLGRLVSTFDNNDPMITSDDVSCAYSYDPLNRILTESQNGAIVTNVFDALHKICQYNPSGDRLRFQYNKDHQVTQVLYNGTVVANNQFNNINQLTSRALGNGVTITQAFDGNGVLLDMHAKKNNQERLHLGYVYDLIGRKTSETDLLVSSQNENYGYDSVNRVTSWNRGTNSQSWNLDPLANWLTTTNNGILESRTFDVTNAVTNRTIGINTEPIAHDLDGNLKSDSKFKYSFDALNRLIEVRNPDQSLVVKYQVDAINRRIAKIIGNTTTTSIYNGWQVAEEKEVVQLKKQSKITLHAYAYGQYIDEPLMMATTQPNGNKKQIWYLHNQQYSVYALLNDNGKIVETYHYSAYGHPTIENSNGVSISVSAFDNAYMYTGRNQDSETGLQYFRNRYYSDSNGGFISRDPIGYVDGMSLFRGYFVVYNLDPFGLNSLKRFLKVKDTNVVQYTRDKWGRILQGIPTDVVWSASVSFDYSCTNEGKPFIEHSTTSPGDGGVVSNSTEGANGQTLKVNWSGSNASYSSVSHSISVAVGGTGTVVGGGIITYGLATGTVITVGTAFVGTPAAVAEVGITSSLGAAILGATAIASSAIYSLESYLGSSWSIKLNKKVWTINCKCIDKKWVPQLQGEPIDVTWSTDDSDHISYSEEVN